MKRELKKRGFGIWLIMCFLRTICIMGISILGLIPFINQIIWKLWFDKDAIEMIQDNIWKLNH
jgi:hypothetical protein